MSNAKRVLRPASYSAGVKSISDDDLCSGCRHCDYRPGDMSGCALSWPGLEDENGYVQECANLEQGNGKPQFYFCGICGEWHRTGFYGDCRDDASRFTYDQLDAEYGAGGWVEAPHPN